MTTTLTPDRLDDDHDRRLLESTVIERPSGGAEVVFHDDSDDLSMTAFIAADADEVFDLSTMR